MEHGTRGGYTNHGCRCEPCREAESAYRRTRRGQPRTRDNKKHAREERNRRAIKHTTAGHGTTTGYRNGCRCDDCRWAINVYQRVRNGGTAPKQPGKFKVTPSTSGGNKHD